MWYSGRASGGAGGPERSISPALIKVVLRNGLGVGGIEFGGLVEVFGERFVGGLVCFPTAGPLGPHGELGLGRAPGGVDQRRGGRLTDVGEDLSDGVQVSQERDKGEGFLAGGTDQGEDFIDPGQESGPPGWPGGGSIRCPRLGSLCLGSWGRGGCRERERGIGSVGGEGIILPGLFGDQRSQGRIGGEDAVVAVAMDAGWRKNRGQAVQELQSGEAQRGTAGGIGLGEDVENLVGAAANQVEPVEGERTPGTVADEALQTGAVGGLDADAGVQAKAAAVIPREHILCLMGFQEAVASEVAEDPFSHRVLEALQELVGESRSCVEAEVGS